MESSDNSNNASLKDPDLSAHRVGKVSGLPEHLKVGVERLSGLSMDDVRVYNNSLRPVAFGAHAYSTRDEIYLAPGQEKLLAHELCHVVQQRGGPGGRTFPQPTQGQIAQQAVVAELAGDPPLTPAPDAVGKRAVQK
jgi:hypothetical protein